MLVFPATVPRSVTVSGHQGRSISRFPPPRRQCGGGLVVETEGAGDDRCGCLEYQLAQGRGRPIALAPAAPGPRARAAPPDPGRGRARVMPAPALAGAPDRAPRRPGSARGPPHGGPPHAGTPAATGSRLGDIRAGPRRRGTRSCLMVMALLPAPQRGDNSLAAPGALPAARNRAGPQPRSIRASTSASLISGCLVAVSKVSVLSVASSRKWASAPDRSGSVSSAW